MFKDQKIVDFQEVSSSETKYIRGRREGLISKNDLSQFKKSVQKNFKLNVACEKVGLAISGGGIRSATFNLGFIQRLAKSNVLKFCDYLSTVSGGGYIGSSLTSLLESENASVSYDKFPFRFRKSSPDERQEVKWLRRHGNYLFPKMGLFKNDTWSFIALFLTGIVLVNIPTVYFSIIGLYVLDLIIGKFDDPIAIAHNMLVFSGAIVALMITIRGVTTLWDLGFKIRTIRSKLLGALGLIAFLIALVAGLFYLAYYLPMLKEETKILIQDVLQGTALTTGAGLLTGLLGDDSTWVGKIKSILFKLATILAIPVVMAVLIRFIWTNDLLYANGSPVLAIVALCLFVTSMFINSNRLSMHHFYRDRLSEAYIIKRDHDREGEAIESNDELSLSKLHNYNNGAPYHLINTTVNLPSSKDRHLRGRKADIFLFSKNYCGSDITGYAASDTYDGGKTKLATAMAISGAAASPQMGLYSSKILGFMMTLLNVRLNRWMPNPKKSLLVHAWPVYYLRELLSWGDEDDRLLNLSDGGHYENLGIYQLLKRRCDLIIASDGGCDPDFTFEDLANLLAKARIDMGIEIDMDLSDLRPDSNGNSKARCAVGTINYPEGDTGLLVYCKTSITGDEPEDVLAYRRLNPDFPDQTTADQFFDESQFESYRQLGYVTAKEVFGLSSEDEKA